MASTIVVQTPQTVSPLELLIDCETKPVELPKSIIDEVTRLSGEAFGALHPFRYNPGEVEQQLRQKRSLLTTVKNGGYNNALLGYALALPIEHFEGVARVNELPEELKFNTAYVDSFATAPALAGHGVGGVVMKELIAGAINKGYDRIAGHFRDGASAKAARRAFQECGVACELPCPGYDPKSGETYFLIVSGDINGGKYKNPC